MLRRTLLAGTAGVLLALASAPVGWTILAPVSVALLVLSVRGMRARAALLPGLVFGIGHFFVLLWWMRAVGWDAWLALSAAQAVVVAPLGSALALVGRLRWWPVWSALCWVAVETIRSSWPFGGLPWGRLSYTVADTWWAASLPWLGFTGLSLLLAGTGAALAWWVSERPPLRQAAPVAAGLLALTLWGTVVPWQVEEDATMRIAVVQGDVPGSGDDLVAVHRDVTRNHVEATIDLAAQVRAGEVEAPDLVVWPENSTAVDPFRDAEVNAGIERASATIDAPILIGAMTDGEEPDAVLNQGIVWSPQTGPGDRYTKRHPVAFGEYIPWRDTLVTGNFGKLRLIGRDMLSGTRTDPLVVGPWRVADAICFDVAYDDAIHEQLGNGAQVLAVQTSNAMFIRTHQIQQQYEITRLRALETGRSVVVAATNGVSGVIAPDGSVVDQARPRTTSVLVQDVVLDDGITPAVAMGPWPGRAAVLLALIGCVLGARRGRGDALCSPGTPPRRGSLREPVESW
ncbi:apolipoprotein N-acyltransferase [Nocardioides campestrisoli]|uniref:apolipoprotein N-acyltransferase n=1 Tax=Nocardioides campestrisoli TaxID=2736757 RepID=UPI00163DCFF5|nr:apolipoprotein N-acyltransferase [Nocardioides campestrisoli]